MADVLSPAQPGQLYSVPGFPTYLSSIPGGGVGAVTSVFGRVGAVVAQNGDYDSGQVTNVSGVAGATVSAALNTLNTSATQLVSNTQQGQVPQTNGTAGQALIATAGGTTWSTNFQAQNLATTGFISIGALLPATGALRLANGSIITYRNNANTADLNALVINSADGLIMGNVSSTTVINGPPGALNGIRFLINAATVLNIGSSISILTSSISFDSSQTDPIFSQAVNSAATATGFNTTYAAQDCSGTTVVTAGDFNRRGGNATGGAGTRNGGNIYDKPGTGATKNGNWGWFVLTADGVNFQSMQGGIYWKDRTAAPTGNPAGGAFMWSETGGLPTWRTAAGDVLQWTSTTAATATAGGGAALPATISEYITVSFKGNVRKIPTYAN